MFDRLPSLASSLRAARDKTRAQAGPIVKDTTTGIGILGKSVWFFIGPIVRLIWHFLTLAPLWRRVLFYGASVFFAVTTLVLIAYLEVTKSYTPEENVDLWQINRPPSLTLLDRHGENIGTRGSHYGDPVPLRELPPYVAKAFMATEDRRFYRHIGIDPKGFTRAMLANLRAGRIVQGGSTITQQLVKNLFLNSDRTVNRKLQELHLAFWLESRLTKDEILSLYLNRTYLGAGAYGIEAASNIYFNKSARDLTLSEAALLAGLPKAPSSLSPTRNFDGANSRAREVIDNLVEAGELDAVSAEIAKYKQPSLDPKKLNTEFGYFFDAALREAQDTIGNTETDLVIQTTVDAKTQFAASDIVRASLNEETVALGAEQAALVAFDNETGAIIAMVGGASYQDSQFNRATQALRQPGSIFKPIVYLAALESGMTPRTLLVDQPIFIKDWRPVNYGDKFKGPMRMTQAVAQSVNTVAIQTAETIGREKVVEAAQRLGITHPLKEHASLALGSMEIPLREITSAYLPFARGGLSITPHAVTKIETRSGEILFERGEEEITRIFDAKTSEQVNHLLFQVLHSGTGKKAQLPNRPAAGKTGTTNDWRDAWFVGYTPQITTGVWVGNDASEPMKKVTGGSVPATIWHDFMIAAHEGLEPLKLKGAKPAKSRSEIRLKQLYNAMFEDLRRTEYGSVYVSPQPEEDYPLAETFPIEPESPPQRRRRRIWPF